MRGERFWLKLILLCAIIAIGLAVGLAALTAGAALALAQGQELQTVPGVQFQAASARTFSGVISDSVCAARHETNMNMGAHGCTRMCVARQAKYALVGSDSVYTLQGGTEALDKYAGERVSLSGVLDGDTIMVTEVAGLTR
jgi:hypothetical protein